MKLIPARTLSDWIKVYTLYKSAFPIYERKPFPMIINGVKRGISDVLIIEHKGKFLGLVITIKSDKLVLVDYFAVCPKMRGKGVGSAALMHIRRKYKNKRIFLEIESVYKKADNLLERKRRKSFYLKNELNETGVFVKLFGVDMELLGFGCKVSFEEYHRLYSQSYGKAISENVKKA